MKTVRQILIGAIVILTIGFASYAKECSCAPDFTKIAKDVSPSVVNIFTTQVVKVRGFGPGFGDDMFRFFFGDEFFKRFFGDIPRTFKRRSLGSGFIIDKKGYIVTNNHVVEKATEIKVVLMDGSEFKAKLIGTDPKTDLALLKIDPKGKELKPVKLGDSDKLQIGEWVLAIGNPFGLSYTVTAGIVSAKGRELGTSYYEDFIQTDASINPGNSGGPLINMKGEVVGINTAIIANAQGIGFAIPINLAKQIIKQLKEKGRVIRGWLGVYIQAITPDLMKALKLKSKKGAIVTKVVPNSPAERAGIKPGDIIVKYNNKPINKLRDLSIMVANTSPGKLVEIEIIRNGKRIKKKVRIGELKEKTAKIIRTDFLSKFGLRIEDIPEDIKAEYGIRHGAFVSYVKPGSLAQEAGFRRGDIIIEINRQRVKNAHDVYSILSKVKKGDFVTFLVNRGEGALFITVRVE